jgi:transcription initiation factor IIF auxiliary subunit
MSITTNLKINQSQIYRGDDWWSWSVWIDGSEDELNGIAKVEYTLHPTFPKPVRIVETRDNRFKLSTEGWGGFLIYASVFQKDGSLCHLQPSAQSLLPGDYP